MKKPSPLILCILVLLALRLSAQTRHSQSHSPVVLKATVDKQRILIGQPVQLMLEATVPAGTSLTWPALDSLPHFEWVEKGKVDSTIHPDQRYFRQYLTITSFDSGTRVIPRLPFIAGRKTYFSDSVRIEVGYSKFDPSKDFHDIKDIIEVPNPFARWIGWIVAAVTLLALALAVWLVRQQKQLIKVPGIRIEKPRLSPYEEAARQLEELEKQRLVENGQVKQYYSRLSEIFRLFVLRRLGINSLAETSEELIGQLRRLDLPRERFTALSETLLMTDFVKFAKYQPGLTDNEHNLRVIRSSVELLNEIGENEPDPDKSKK